MSIPDSTVFTIPDLPIIDLYFINLTEIQINMLNFKFKVTKADGAAQHYCTGQAYVVNLLHTKLNPAFIFHNLDHTKDVVRASELLADFYKISDEDRLPLLVAAWFHDTGYIGSIAKGHEYISQKIATEFLKGRADEDFIARVNKCIDSTRVPQSPGSQIEMIMCDADLFHLGTESFDDRNKLLRKEINKFAKQKSASRNG